MSGTGTEVCPLDSHTGCVWSPLGALPQDTHPLCPLRCAEICSWARRGDKVSVTIMNTQRAEHRADFVVHSLCRPCSANSLKLYQEVLWSFFHLSSLPLRRVLWETLTTWAPGAPGGQGISTGPLLLVRSKGKPGEELGCMIKSYVLFREWGAS